MSKLIFINLPVADLARSTAFYEAVGATKNPQFSNEQAACMVFSDTIHVMLSTHVFFGAFAPKKIADAKTTVQAFFAISADSRAEVDATVGRAHAFTGGTDPSPVDEYGWMYGRSFEDPDGHMWGVNWMDMEAAASAMAAPEPATA